MLAAHQSSSISESKGNLARKDWLVLLAVVFVALICFLPGLNSYGALDPTDSFFIEAAREMIQCHHYIIGLANYAEWYEKPVLSIWLTVASYKLFGISPWVGRLPQALSGVILVITTYLFTLSKLGRRAAVLAAVILCTSPLFSIVGHVALTDELLCMLFGIAMLYAGVAITTSNKKISLFAYVFLALAVLCKGPIAIVLAFGSLILYLFIVSKSWETAKEAFFCLRPLVGALIILVLCLPYFYAAHVTTHGVFTEQHFLRQNIGRMQGTVNHQEAMWYYVPVFFAGYFPWCLYLLLGIPWLKRILSFRFTLTERQKFIVFCLCWLVFVAALFILVPTKLYTYILPLSPALAIVTAAYLDALVRSKAIESQDINRPNRGKKILLFPPLLCLIASLIALFLAAKIIKGSLLVIFCSGFIAIVIMSLRAYWSFWFGKYNKGVANLSMAAIAASAILVPSGFRWFYDRHQVIVDRSIAIVKEQNGNLATLFSPVPSTDFYLGHQVPTIGSLTQLAEFCKDGKCPHFLLASRNCLKMSELEVEKHTVITNGKWYLLKVDGFPWQK